MTDEVMEKIKKVQELVLRGVDGEQEAAKKALERLIKKYNLSEKEVAKIGHKMYAFRYATDLDVRLLKQLFRYFFEEKYTKCYKNTWRIKEIALEMEYLDYIQIEMAYGYFKPHMSRQWRLHGLPQLSRYRSAKNKNKRRKELQDAFFRQYILKSKIYHENQIVDASTTEVTNGECKDYASFRTVEGGSYRTEISTGLYLE